MRENGRKGGGGRSIRGLIWLPLVVALLAQYALTAPLLDSAGSKAPNSAPTVTYEVTVTQNGQVHASAVREASSAAEAIVSGGSAAEAFLQAVGEDDSDNALHDEESPLEVARSRIEKEVAAAKAQQLQASKERSEQLRVDNLIKHAVGLDGLKVRGYDISDERMVQLIEDPLDYTVDIEFIDQTDLMPSGCEIIALSIALHCMGYDEADPIEIADEYIEYGGDSAKYFTGTPYGDGGGFPPCIVTAANKWLKDNGGGAKAFDLTGSSFEGLCALVELGYPVLVWTTDGMADPYVGSEWYFPEHCVVMYGLEKEPVQNEKSAAEKKGTGSASGSGAAVQVKNESSVSTSNSASSSSSSSSSSASASSKSAASAKSSSSAASSSASKSSSAAASSKSASKKSSSKSAESSSAMSAPTYAKVKVSDSLEGLISRDYDDFKRIYDKAGKRALFIQPNAK